MTPIQTENTFASSAPGPAARDKQIPWRRKRRLGMAVAGITPTASQLTKTGKMQSAGCQLGRRVRGVRGESTESLAVETYCHISSAGCEGIATTVTAQAAHHCIHRANRDSSKATKLFRVE